MKSACVGVLSIILWNKFTTLHIMLCDMFQQNFVGKELCCTHTVSQECI